MESATRLGRELNDSKVDESLEGGCSLNSKNNSVANGYPDHRSPRFLRGKVRSGEEKGSKEKGRSTKTRAS